MKTKNSRRLRNLMLLTSLCAILSCSSGGGGGSGKSYIGNNTPINPPIVNPTPGTPVTPVTPVIPPAVETHSRFTTTPDQTKLKLTEGIYDKSYYTQEGDNSSNIGSAATVINASKYGIELDPITPVSITSATEMTIKENGAAFLIHTLPMFIGKNEIKDIFNHSITHADNMTLHMDEGSALLMIQEAIIALSDSDFSNILSEVTAPKPIITGKGYNEIKFIDSGLAIDENINLDDDNDNKNYSKAISNIKPIGILLASGFNLTGKSDGQVAIKSAYSENQGTIKLTGKNSVALFSNNYNLNLGDIEVGEDSIAQYTIRNTVWNGIAIGNVSTINSQNITLGKNSTGIRIDRNYNNISAVATVDPGAIIKSTAENVTGIMLYTRDAKHTTGDPNVFRVKQKGEINLSGDRSTGIYLDGAGKATATNKGKIIMGDSSDRNNPSIAMYSTYSENEMLNTGSGLIKVGKNSIGMAGVNGGKLTNEAEIVIAGDGGVGMYLADGTEGINRGMIKTDGTGLKDVVGVIVGKNSKFTNEPTGVIDIDSENGTGVLIANGGIIDNQGTITVTGTGSLEQRTDNSKVIKVMSDRVTPVKAISVKSDMGIYVNSLGKTNPIDGLANLGLNSADLLIGAEAAEKTNATEVTVGQDVLKPFNDSMHASRIADWTVKSGSLIWEAEPEIKDNRIEKVTLKKQSYTKFADERTEGVARGLDEKYIVASEKDKKVFNYMNTLRNAESLGKVYSEINGSQYINVQQRINQTDNLLDKQISYLQKENIDKAGHHITTFFDRNRHDFKTVEVPNTTSTAYGVTYLFNNTGSRWGIFGGAAINRYKFKDTAHSRENITMFKLGGYKTFDLNGVDWTLSGDVFASHNDMKRRFMVGTDVYENKADYNAYGFSVKNEISKTYQIGENGTARPYGALKLGYGKFSSIREKDGTMGMDIKGNSFHSIKPSAGIELAYTKEISNNAKFKAALDLAYEHELGKVDRKENEMKFINTNQVYRLKAAKDERRGNFRSGLKVGFETGNFNFSVNGGYDTSDKNAHIGVGFGASF